jgi:hypothetical protein
MNGTVSLESRIASIDIYADDLPILKAVGDGKGERSYALCARDSTVITKYSSEKLFVLEELLKFYERHKDEISVSKHRQFIDYLLKQGLAVKMDITLDQLGVHLFNSRYIPVEKIEGFEQLVSLAERGRLMNEIIVTPVDSDMVKAFKYIAESAKKHGRDPVNALAGILCRRAMSEGDELVVLEDDRLYQLAMRCGWEGAEKDGGMKIKYLVVDGSIRFVAAREAFARNIDKWRKVPTISAIVIPAPPTNPKKPALGMDPVAVFYLSVTANSFARDINEDLSRFVKLFQAGDVIEMFGKRMRFEILEKFGEVIKAREDIEIKRMGYIKQEPIRIEYREPIEESVEEKRPEEEEEKREERRWERREEPARRADVSGVQRQFVPAPSYAPAQPQNAIQMPMSHPASAQPIREEAQRSGQTQPVQLNEISVLSVALDQYFARHNPQAHYYVFQGKGVDVRLDYNLKKALENSGLSGRSLEVDIRYTDITDLPVKGMQLKARIYVPVAWGKHCPNCGHLIVLSPTRCVFCGEVISPLPYVVSYKPAGT